MVVAVSDVVDHLSTLPPFPKITAKLISLLNDPEVTVDEFTAVISSDPSLMMKIIQLANSPFYMVSRRIESVRRAIFVLGFKTIKTITTAVALQKGIASYRPRDDVFDFVKFWEHSYATAISASCLAEKNNKKDRDKLYLAGLIHDVGKIILAYHWPESWKQVTLRIQNSEENFNDIESMFFSLGHAELAAKLCGNWQFPDDIVQMIEYHNKPDEAPAEYADISRLLYLADNIAISQGYEFPKGENGSDSPDLTGLVEMVGDLKSGVEYQLKSFGGHK